MNNKSMNPEISAIYKEANSLADDTLKRSENCIDVLRNARELGKDTNKVLNDQTDQIKNMEKSLTVIEKNNIVAEKKLNSISSVFSTFGNWISGVVGMDKPESKYEKKYEKIDKKYQKSQPELMPHNREKPASINPMIKDMDDDNLKCTTMAIHKNLEIMDDITTDLYNEAIAMDRKLKYHNEKLPVVMDQLDRNSNKVQKNIQRCSNILN